MGNCIGGGVEVHHQFFKPQPDFVKTLPSWLASQFEKQLRARSQKQQHHQQKEVMLEYYFDVDDEDVAKFHELDKVLKSKHRYQQLVDDAAPALNVAMKRCRQTDADYQFRLEPWQPRSHYDGQCFVCTFVIHIEKTPAHQHHISLSRNAPY